MTTPPWDSISQLPPTLRLSPYTPSKALRRDNVGRCMYCYNRVWWFDRADGGRIPLIPMEFPTARVPRRAQWSVDAGLARPGAMRDSCWIAHPTVCPGIEGDEPSEAGLADLRRQCAINMQTAIREGKFTAPLMETDDNDEALPAAARQPCRDVMAYHSVHLLVPTTVQELRCVALTESTNERCQNPVLDSSAGYQGDWAEQEIPLPQGRAGRPALWEGQTMWVWSLNSVDYQESVRWRNQRCPDHGAGSTAPDASPRECEHFDPFLHGAHIRHIRPQQAASVPPGLPGAQRTRCAGENCINGNEGHVPEHEIVLGVGWLCWKCRPKRTRRQATHRRWQT
ncbi:DUF6083 domain-containing protein [Streptomyces sp. NPDC004244]